MQIRIVTIPFSARLGGFDDEPLRSFIADKQVHSFESWHFVHEGMPYWSYSLSYTYDEASAAVAKGSPVAKLEKVDWRKRLSDKDWPVFNALREWRKARSSEEGIPPYLVFTNEQLTQVVLEGIDSLTALGGIAGVGPSRVEKYGKEQLHIKRYLRYMDDFLCFADEKSVLQETVCAVEKFLDVRLALSLKQEKCYVAPVSQGIPFLGVRVYPGALRLSRQALVRARRSIGHREHAYNSGRISEEKRIQSVGSLLAHIAHADTMVLRRKWFAAKQG